jgi:hypothetical protein
MLFLFACGVIPQLHMSAPIVWIPLFLLVRPTLRSWTRRYALIGLALVLIAYVPLAIHEATTGLGNTRAFLAETFKGGAQRSHTFLLIPLYLVRFVCFDTSFHTLMGYWGGLDELRALRFLAQGNADRPFSPVWFSFLIFSVALALLAVTVAIRHAALRRRRGEPLLGPFAVAALAGIAADLVFVGATGKIFFPPYAQPLLPLLFLPHVILGMTLGRHPRGRLALAGLLALWAIGGAEATWAASSGVDGRNGLAVKRAVVERIHADGDAGGSPPGDPVDLGSTYFHHARTFEVLSQLAYQRPLVLRYRPQQRRYRLQRPYDPPPGNVDPGAPPLALEHAVLYRLR